jgi:hypothetical protein
MTDYFTMPPAQARAALAKAMEDPDLSQSYIADKVATMLIEKRGSWKPHHKLKSAVQSALSNYLRGAPKHDTRNTCP